MFIASNAMLCFTITDELSVKMETRGVVSPSYPHVMRGADRRICYG